jgi:hypothetical protein
MQNRQGYVVDLKMIKEVIGRTALPAINIPDKSKFEFIEEMVRMGLLKKICRLKYELIERKDIQEYDSWGNPLFK